MSLERTYAFQYLKKTDLSFKTLGLREIYIEPTSPYKSYPQAERIELPLNRFPETPNFFEILRSRRSDRKYRGYPITKEEIALLCFAVQGVTAKAGPYLLRTAPSAGALYPIETYLAVNYAQDLTPGIYHFEIRSFTLEKLREGNFGKLLRDLALGQAFFESASVVFLWSAVFRRTMAKYGERGLRYIFMDVAHISQNLLLTAVALGFKACPVGAFLDEEVTEFLDLDGNEERVIYLATVGK
ncbi:MAG: SagB/ThcOx family dehydrogenase [Caldimicrobium sp.]|nr:SagB/ThcOx family dehydrogenase [Caldimicrobium sp.]MCX7612922.1 SagB/ThcOx family dehydrogenase [Caldimicrobium sp.]MDW8182111.1 SagB/ThcOx family dehydrogenase [Caldimicrobium sp.]